MKNVGGVMIIITPSNGGNQKTICLPLRKLPAYFASINPSKVKPELKEKIELYQEECDNALWEYWNNRSIQIKTEKNITVSDLNQFKIFHEVLSTCYEGNQLTLALDKCCKKLTGQSALEASETQLIAQKQE